MRVYAMVRPQRLEEFPEAIRRAESLGYDGVTLLELDRAANPFSRDRRDDNPGH